MYSGIKDCSERYAVKAHISKKEAEARLKDIIDVLCDEMADPSKEGIQFIDKFTLKKKLRKPRVGRNPNSPTEEFQIAETIGFKCELGKSFNQQLNG